VEVGGVVLVIDAKNERVAQWYASYGAMQLLDAPLCLVLPLATIEAALRKAEKPGDLLAAGKAGGAVPLRALLKKR
jgi:hypothetical protein